ncbi:hypothetical protein D3877_27780 [Azospirillum cavernae]|uniref:Uncharacterized protein n=1 Tax=Azospirillum cavernae TaxID=2320860 RepID=A0A418VN72_9PROT|nr:hypothetical protein [Azospirillum cavernae]RJF77559.1 hypothetical protein D3877_27780 [Azospirillum cavernae]
MRRMALASSSYEVQIYQADHWVLDSCFESEADARAYGKRILSGGKIEGIRVVRDWARPDGRHVETEIHQEFRSVSNSIVISPIDEAPPLCHSAEACFGVEGRMVMNRLLRNYVERIVVTPTELLHNHTELKRLLDKDNLVPTAVGRVAVLQAEQAGLDSRSRRDELYGFLNSVTERARVAAARKDLPNLERVGFRPAFESLAAKEDPESCDFLARALLSRDLVQMRNWLAKLDFLGELVRQDGGLTDRPLTLIDGVIADVLGAPSVAQELLGLQGSLAEALCNLIDLSRGRLDVSRRAEDDRAVHLNELLAFHDLDETRHVMIDLVRRQLKSNQPLYRADPGQEREAFQRVLRRVTTPDGLIGGGGMAEALVLRYLRFLEGGGAAGRRRAMEEVCGLHADAKEGLRFVMALSQSDLGRQHADDVARLLNGFTGDPRGFGRFVDRSQPIKINLELFTKLYTQVRDSAAPEPLKATVAENIDTLLVAYIHDCKLVERIDNPSDPLRHRANRLMQLCAPGTLQSRKALAVVRERVVSHLRQPQFEQKYVADLTDPTLQQTALREFYRLLGQAGLT